SSARFALNGRIDAFAELIVGDAENRAVVNARTALKHGLDFRGIDIDPAGDDHVALAVVEKQIAVGIEVADVATGDQSVDLDGAAIVVTAVIVEIRISRRTREDFTTRARRQFTALLVKNLDR